MKIIIITLLSLLLLTGLANAQHANIGVKGGVNASTVSANNNTFDNMKLGFHLGLLGHIHITDQFALQPELVFSNQGSKYNVAGSEVNLNLNYLNVPLLFQYMFDNGFRFQAGPQVGFLTSAKTKIGNAEANVKNDYESLDFGVTVGISYVNPATNFGFDFRYNHGLSNIRSNANENVFNRGFQAGVFFLFIHH